MSVVIGRDASACVFLIATQKIEPLSESKAFQNRTSRGLPALSQRVDSLLLPLV